MNIYNSQIIKNRFVRWLECEQDIINSYSNVTVCKYYLEKIFQALLIVRLQIIVIYILQHTR